MAAPNMNGRLLLKDVHQNSPASLRHLSTKANIKFSRILIIEIEKKNFMYEVTLPSLRYRKRSKKCRTKNM